MNNLIETILDFTDNGLLAVDKDLVITLFNKAAERITGLKAEDLVDRPVSEAIPTTRLPIVMATGEPELNWQQEIANTTIITSRIPVRDATGAVVGAVAIFHDISELKSLTGQVSDLWEARSLLEEIIEALGDAISVADENGNTIIVNRAYTRITGLSRAAVLNKPVTVDIAEGESMHMKVLRTGEPVRNFHMRVGPLRNEVLVNVAPILLDGKIRGSVGVIHDISDIMALTSELSTARKIIRQLQARYTLEDIIGAGPAMANAKEKARRAAETPATVSLRGESGTGKELFAHAIHNASPRSRGQFVRVNCAAIAEGLLESELFGYEEGAFTGALRGGRKGFFEEADGGTIFLDEIGEISLPIQSKLLRVLQEREVVRVGGSRPVSVDVRVIAATNADLEQKVHSREFREDLYYRLNVVPLYVPPLRERKEDIPLLAKHIMLKLNREFGRHVETISGSALQELARHNWPGNVRELENIMGRSMINMRPRETAMEAEHLPAFDCGKTVQSPVFPSGLRQPLEKTVGEAEKAAIISALSSAGGSRTKAAGLLGIALRSLHYKLKKYAIK